MKNIWGIISALAGVSAVIIAFYVLLEQKTDQSKQLEVELIANSNLVNTEISRGEKKVEIFYDGRRVDDYSIYQFRIYNSGGQPITSDDYEQELQINFLDIAEVLSAKKINSDPNNIPAEILTNKNRVVVRNTLLNPKDWLIVEVGVIPKIGVEPEIQILGRIIGVKIIIFKNMLNNPNGKDDLLILILAYALGTAGSIMATYAYITLRLIRKKI